MSKFKRWYYELTKKQVEKIVLGTVIFCIIIDVINFFITSINGNLPKDDELLYYIFSLFFLPIILGLLVYYILWEFIPKQIYLEKKAYTELCIKVKKRFNLGTEFKEVTFSPCAGMYSPVNFAKMIQDSEITFFAKEENGKILLSIHKDTDKEPSFFPIEDYDFFNKNFSPKE